MTNLYHKKRLRLNDAYEAYFNTKESNWSSKNLDQGNEKQQNSDIQSLLTKGRTLINSPKLFQTKSNQISPQNKLENTRQYQSESIETKQPNYKKPLKKLIQIKAARESIKQSIQIERILAKKRLDEIRSKRYQRYNAVQNNPEFSGWDIPASDLFAEDIQDISQKDTFNNFIF